MQAGIKPFPRGSLRARKMHLGKFVDSLTEGEKKELLVLLQAHLAFEQKNPGSGMYKIVCLRDNPSNFEGANLLKEWLGVDLIAANYILRNGEVCLDDTSKYRKSSRYKISDLMAWMKEAGWGLEKIP
jgi:hypothetical protein